MNAFIFDIYSLTLEMFSSTKLFTLLSSVWAVSRTLPPICVFGPSAWHMHVCMLQKPKKLGFVGNKLIIHFDII